MELEDFGEEKRKGEAGPGPCYLKAWRSFAPSGYVRSFFSNSSSKRVREYAALSTTKRGLGWLMSGVFISFGRSREREGEGHPSPHSQGLLFLLLAAAVLSWSSPPCAARCLPFLHQVTSSGGLPSQVLVTHTLTVAVLLGTGTWLALHICDFTHPHRAPGEEVGVRGRGHSWILYVEPAPPCAPRAPQASVSP